MSSLRRTYIDGKYGQVHCRISEPASSGRLPIVCLHMCPKSGRSYQDVLPLLAADRLAVAPDFPGHGESDKPPADPHVTIEDFAENTWQVIDALTHQSVHIVGYHTGSMVAVEAALQRPQQVASIVLMSAPIFTTSEIATLEGYFEPIPIDEAGTRFRENWQRVMENRGPGVSLSMLAESFAENLRAGDDYEWGHRAAFAYADRFGERVAQVGCPIRVLNPNDDCYEATLRVDALLQNGKREDFMNWGHGFLNAFPEQAATVILDFVNKVETDD